MLVFKLIYKDSKNALIIDIYVAKHGHNHSRSVPVVFLQSSAQASFRFSNVFVSTFPTWNFIDYTLTFSGGYNIFLEYTTVLSKGVCNGLGLNTHTPLNLICYKNCGTYAKEIVFAYFLLVNLST